VFIASAVDCSIGGLLGSRLYPKAKLSVSVEGFFFN
jgi:hypothetical protein